nr:MAG TPA: hypothetical protein [Caudoviricetes sp.]
MDNNTSQLLLALDEQRQNLAANLSQKGVAAQSNEGLETLVPKVLDISGGGSDKPAELEYDIELKIYSPTDYYNIRNIDFDLYNYMIVIPYYSGDYSMYHTPIPEVGESILIPTFFFHNSYYGNYSILTSQKVQCNRYEDRINFSQSTSTQNIFPQTGTGKCALYLFKKPTQTAATFSMRKTRARVEDKYIIEEGNLVPLIVNEDMTEGEILVLFHTLEATKNNDNIYVLNNPLVTSELAEVVQNKGYNIIYR